MFKPQNQYPRIKILDINREYSGFLNIDKAIVLQSDFEGTEKKVSRDIMERGDAVAILLHDPFRRCVVFMRQARIPPLTRNDNGWLLEIVAGSVNKHDDNSEMVIRETREETGLKISHPRYLGSFYLSPGGTSERCHLYESKIDSSGIHGNTAGEEGSDENTRVEVIPFDMAMKMIDTGEICDAKTIIALQNLALGKISGW